MSARIPLPSLDARIPLHEQAPIRRQFITASFNAQADWMDKIFKKLMPRRLYEMAHNESGPWEAFEKRQKMVLEWLTRNDIRVVQRGMHIQQLFRGKELLSTFIVKIAEK